MSVLRPLLALTLCGALAGAALADPAGRKGTRNYRPDGSAAPATETPGTPTVSRQEKLQHCMETWDTGTHISKSKWREICLRQLDER